jgi:REP element-mobilizing transposase RayT
MPRHARLDASGFLHHVIIRGIERKPIFEEDRDKEDFIQRCGILLPETMTACYAWSILSNHIHMLLRTGTVPLSTVMSRLLTGYATAYNLRHKRSGHLFQNRYKSVICQEDAYFKELVRYIHLNPIRAHLTDFNGLKTFPWSGHAVLLGKKEHLWQDTDYVISLFGNQTLYLKFVRAGINQGRREDLTGGGLVRSHCGWTEVRKSKKDGLIKGDDRILGDTLFVTRVLSLAEEKLEQSYAVKSSGITLDFVERKVCDLFGMTSRELYEQGRQKRLGNARSLFCFFAVRELGISMKILAERFSITEPAIGYSVRRGQKIAEEKGWVLIERE